ncbi:DNA-processing protein DprA [Mesobacillus harenae]|uniref:DNA-processing protein DprA n=1 Tax=Mesobacillus harenae TaxID=2213203 RepID=UPI00158031C6|nr:DNA-processing protein DprA [Mesobacillus harenae]
MDEFRKRLLHLHLSTSSWKTIFTILKADPTLERLYKIPLANSPNFSFTDPSVQAAITYLRSTSIETNIQQYNNGKIYVLTIFDEIYPQALKETYQPPWILFAKGDISLLREKHLLAVVGSRAASSYAKRTVEFLMPELIESGLVIVSGLAKGIDALAHKTAIENGGKTIGVIAGGFWNLYPAETKRLAMYMMEKQLVVSEYAPESKPARWQFPMRNRIISGLSKGTLVVEAKKKSGSLITADFSMSEGREVFAIPGDILTSESEGVHELIQQGAKLVKSAKNILEELNLSY